MSPLCEVLPLKLISTFFHGPRLNYKGYSYLGRKYVLYSLITIHRKKETKEREIMIRFPIKVYINKLYVVKTTENNL